MAPWMLVGALAAQAPAPSLAVMTLTAEEGVAPSTTRLLTDVVLQELQATRAFSRVVSAREMESVLGLEAQRQLLTCSEGSCVAELAGSLGVDLMLTGAVGRVGEVLLLNLRLVDARAGVVRATRSVKMTSADQGALVDAVRPTVRSLLAEAHVAPGTPVTTKSAGGTPVLLAAGVAGFAGAGAGMVLGLVLGVVGAAAIAVPKLVYLPTGSAPWQVRVALMPGAGLAGLGLGGVLVLLGALLGVGGLALVVAHTVVG